MASAWIEHVKAYAKKHGITYKQAMTQAAPSYKSRAKKRKMMMKGGRMEKGIVDDMDIQEQAETMVPQIEDEKKKETDEDKADAVEKTQVVVKEEPKKRKKKLIDKIIPLRTEGKLPPASRKLLEKIGEDKITSLRVDRAPISPTNFLKRISYYTKALKEVNYDDTFHLLLVINDKWELQKNEVVSISKFVKRAKTESVNVQLPKGFDMTINELIDKTRKYMGNRKFSEYNVVKNNCQVFIESVLRANKLLTPELRKFIVQDLDTLFSKLPRGTEKIISALTGTAARLDRLIHGDGLDENGYPTEPKGLILQYSSTEISNLQDIYYSTGKYGDYEVVQAQMYYPENIAIGGIGKLGWEQFPRSKMLGYHKHDVEWVAIYYRNGIPEKVVMSCHGLKEHNIYNYKECVFENGFLKIFVARNSHANYNKPGLKKRVRGLANDVVATDGKKLQFTWQQMKPAKDINYPGCCSIVSGLKTQPKETLTQAQRFNIDRKNGWL